MAYFTNARLGIDSLLSGKFYALFKTEGSMRLDSEAGLLVTATLRTITGFEE